MFELHPQLAADTVVLGRLPLSLVLLVKDANYPWVILVPEREDITEIHQLETQDQQQLMTESCDVSKALQGHFSGDKMNVAALGNMVPQLHLHHVVRYKTDGAWPGPIWGVQPAKGYSGAALQSLQGELKELLGLV